MRYFKLPDLGEGLQEAEIVEWHIKAGDQVEEDQLLLSVETAKAIVEIPSPISGLILRCCGNVGDLIHIGDPLIEFDGEAEDSGTVVGDLKSTESNLEPNDSEQQSTLSASEEDFFIVGSAHQDNISEPTNPTATRLESPEGYEYLRGPRRTLFKTMSLAHEQVVPVSLHDEADISMWDQTTDITIRLIRAIGKGCQTESGFNAWLDGPSQSLKTLQQVDLGIAVDTPDGLFVPVLRNITERDDINLRKGLNALRQAVKERSIPPSEMQGATITLSNFGTLAGQHATPVVVPPMVAIIGAGRIIERVISLKDSQNSFENRPFLPISITFDHRCLTGGEAARFLRALLEDLSKPT